MSRLLQRLAGMVTLLLLLLAVQPQMRSQAAEFPLQEFTLGNGMRFVLLPNEQATAVFWSLWYDVGAADEVPGKTGLAHFLEHLMFKGTKTRAAGDFDNLVKSNGAESNAFTMRDNTTYYVRMQKDLLPQIMAFDADRMRNLVFDDALVATEREVVKEERRQRVENDPAMPFLEERDALLFPDHPYGRPTIGSMTDVENLSAKDAQAFYDRYYHPDNVIAVVSGNLTLAELRKLAESYFSAIPRSGQATRHVVHALPAKSAQQRLEKSSASARWPFLTLSFAVPSHTTATGKDAVALEFAADFLAGDMDSALAKELVIDQHLASDVSAYYDGGNRLAGTFTITASMNTAGGTGFDVRGIEARIRSKLDLLKEQGPSAEEISNFLRRAKISGAFIPDQQQGMAMWIGDLMIHGRDIQDAYSLKSWESLTPDDVRQAVARNLVYERSVTAVLLRDGAGAP